jgi:hypothetical protein
MDAKKTIEKLRGEADRTRLSLYISQAIYADFKKACGQLSPSKVVEELMREFVEDLKDSDSKPVKPKKPRSKKS